MNRYEWLDAYLLAKPGAVKDYKPEWGWWRYQVGGHLPAGAGAQGLRLPGAADAQVRADAGGAVPGRVPGHHSRLLYG